MLFNSLHFLIFFPTVVLLYFSLPHKYRWFMLLLASCYFYMALIPAYILILAFLILSDYYLVNKIEVSIGKTRKIYFLLSLLFNIGTLFVFKYFNFFNANTAALAKFIGWNYSLDALRLALPVGLSFHIFQNLSYVIDVYKGHYHAEKHLGIYALYVMFFPQLVAGPIERPHSLLPQFREVHVFNWTEFKDGLRLMLWGFFKKVVIADRLSVYVDHAFNNAHITSGASLFIASVAFAFQIYCDFSGYSDIALGSARILGFRLMKNFDHPYSAKTMTEFWHRWHISLSSWFRYYVFKQMTGRHSPMWQWYVNIMIVFLLSGLWHGANWTFIVWGGLHGLFLCFGALTKGAREKLANGIGLGRIPGLHRTLKISIIFFLTTIAWVFFRANSVGDAFYILSKIYADFANLFNKAYLQFVVLPDITKTIDPWTLSMLTLSIVIMEFVQWRERKVGANQLLRGWPYWARWILYYCVIDWILFFGYFGNRAFIYYQF